MLDEGTKIYNNLRSGSNEGFNAIETGFKDVLGNSAGEIAYEGTNIVGVAVSLPSALRSGVEIISGAKNIIQDGSLLEEGEKLFSSIKESSGEIGNSLNTVKQLITGEKSITIGVLDTGTGLRIPNISVIDNDIEKISKIENVSGSSLEGVGEAKATIDYVKLSEELGNKIETDGYKVINTETAEQANKDWADIGFDLPPVAENTTVYNVNAGNFSYSRVYLDGYNYPKSRFILRTEDINGLSSEEIAQKYALPKVPNKIVTVELPSDTPLEVSIVGPQETWGTLGGDVQYAIKDATLEDDWFSNIKDLK
ncbi:hypothetical protein SAMN02745134_03921 [Clostridium acidisoli DSM 12555]|uniref:Uncharacterized protein n=1 Tax=Clostridium acidisoli DSM 12555 TaxID=1121291 RepID=A0A1W1XZV1_9CLOT|nr:hypothetical protein SAMN02745134_03921 [Clostridium acidisoli DSM 12555]